MGGHNLGQLWGSLLSLPPPLSTHCSVWFDTIKYKKHHYGGQFNDDYCLSKVSEVHSDDEGLVRVVPVQFRKKNPRESKSVYKSKPLLYDLIG